MVINSPKTSHELIIEAHAVRDFLRNRGLSNGEITMVLALAVEEATAEAASRAVIKVLGQDSP